MAKRFFFISSFLALFQIIIPSQYLGTAFAVSTPLEIQASRLRERTGDGDQIPEPGETYELILDLKNTSASNIASASAVLSTASPLVTLTTSNSSFGSIAVGAIKNNAASPFVFQVRDFQDDPTVSFTVSTNADGITQTLSATISLGIRKVSSNIIQGTPSISGTKVVWAAKATPTSDSNIYLLDLATNQLTQVTTNPFDQVSPSLSSTGDRIVWLDCRHSPTNPLCHDVYLYYVSLNLEQRITTTPAFNRSAPRIDGGTITWSEDGKIMSYSIASNLTRQISPSGVVTPPAISGAKIVWSIRTDSYNVFLHDLSLNQTRQLSARPNQEIAPDISGDRVVWQEDYCSPASPVCNTGDIYLYNATTNQERLITSDPNWQKNPKISDNQIVYEDNRNGNSDIYLYDLALNQEKRLTFHPSDQLAPAISQGKAVWVDNRDASPSIYLKDVVLNQPPVLASIGNKTIAENQTLSFTISATDPDNNPLTYSASNLPSGASFNPATRTFTSCTRDGVYPNIRFTVSDGSLTDFEEITITVTNVNRPPVLDPIGNRVWHEWETLVLPISAADPDGDPLEYSASNLPQGAFLYDFLYINGQRYVGLQWTPTYTQAGTYSVTFGVTDGSLSDSETVTLTINNVNAPPEAGTVTPSSGSSAAGSWRTFTTTYTDLDGAANLRDVYLLINPNSSLGSDGYTYLRYDRSQNLLFVRNNSNSGWTNSGRAPGSSSDPYNEKVKLDCGGTTVSSSGNTLTVNWRIRFRPGAVGSHNTYLRATDASSADTGWVQKGTWSVT